MVCYTMQQRQVGCSQWTMHRHSVMVCKHAAAAQPDPVMAAQAPTDAGPAKVAGIASCNRYHMYFVLGTLVIQC